MLVYSQEDKYAETGINNIKIPEISIEKYKQNPDFDYQPHVNQENFIKQAVEWIKRELQKILYKFFTWILDQKSAKNIVRYILQSLPYISILIFVYLLFKFLIGIDLIKLNNKSNYKLNKIYLSEDEQIIHEEDIEKLILKAIENKNYRLATRYYYLHLLKQLKDAGLIQWNADKTNKEYLQELKKADLKPLFKNLTFIYDYVWYGNNHPGAEDFEKIKNDFQSFSI